MLKKEIEKKDEGGNERRGREKKDIKSKKSPVGNKLKLALGYCMVFLLQWKRFKSEILHIVFSRKMLCAFYQVRQHI